MEAPRQRAFDRALSLRSDHLSGCSAHSEMGSCPVLIRVLGTFEVLLNGRPMSLRHGGKVEALLHTLAMREGQSTTRDVLLHILWPDSDTQLSGQSLNSLMYSLHKQLGDSLGGAAPVLHEHGSYHLNHEAGVVTDITAFDRLARAGDKEAQAGHESRMATFYTRAIAVYRGDLLCGDDVAALVERERLHARYLTLLARLADHCYRSGSYTSCIEYALQMLAADPCREDAHRLAMRCFVRRGERGQALRQYLLCRTILAREFAAEPEPATSALFDAIRHDPTSI